MAIAEPKPIERDVREALPDAEPPSSPPALHSERVDWKRWWRLVLPLVVYAIGIAAISSGNYHEDDTCHFLIARHSWESPAMFLSVWGRPGFTIPYSIVAWVGGPFTALFLCRLVTLSIVVGTAALVTATAKRLAIPHAEWAGVVSLLIPLHFQLSIATLTETICGLYFMAATYLLVFGRPNWSALVLSLTMLTRHEAIVFVAGGMLLFAWRREWLAALLVWTSELAWNVVTWLTIGPPLPWTRYRPTGEVGYGSAGPQWGLVMWLEAVGPVVIPLVLWGSWELLHRVRPVANAGGPALVRNPLTWLDGRILTSADVGRVLIVVGALGTVLLNSLLFMFNSFASGGYARFLVPATPWMSLCVLAGLNAIRPRLSAWLGRPDPIGAGMVGWAFGLSLVAALVTDQILGSFGLDRSVTAFIIAFIAAPTLFVAGAAAFLGGTGLRQPWIAQAGLLAAALSWPVAWGGGALPLRETGTQRLYSKACRWIKEQPQLSGMAVASLWSQGDMHIENNGLRMGSIWYAPLPGESLVILWDTSKPPQDTRIKTHMDGATLVELVRFPVAGASPHNREPAIIVYEWKGGGDTPRRLSSSNGVSFPAAEVAVQASPRRLVRTLL